MVKSKKSKFKKKLHKVQLNFGAQWICFEYDSSDTNYFYQTNCTNKTGNILKKTRTSCELCAVSYILTN